MCHPRDDECHHHLPPVVDTGVFKHTAIVLYCHPPAFLFICSAPPPNRRERYRHGTIITRVVPSSMNTQKLILVSTITVTHRHHAHCNRHRHHHRHHSFLSSSSSSPPPSSSAASASLFVVVVDKFTAVYRSPARPSLGELSSEEVDVLKDSSRVNGKLFLPWIAQDLQVDVLAF